MISYRKFVRTDLDQLRSIYIQGFSALYGDAAPSYADEFLNLYRAALLNEVEGEMFVAERAHTLVGFAVIHKESTKEFKFGPMVVLPSAQKQGIGSQLFQLCINFARSKQIKQFYLKVHETNQSAINLYKKFGLSVTAKLPSNLEGVEFLKMVFIFR